jgi:iron complex outermembrane recepter protein
MASRIASPFLRLLGGALSAVLGLAATGQAQMADDEVVVLSPFEVSAGAEDGYRENEATTGTIIAMPIRNLPMAISVISEQVLTDAVIFDPERLTNYVAGMASSESATTNGGGGNTVFTLRGFNSIPRRNGFAVGGRYFDMTGVARVEIIKGPNSVLYGLSDPGGIVNFVSKRPQFRPAYSASVQVGSYDFYRVQADLTGPIVDGKLAYRLPVSYLTSEREIDFYKNERWVANPSLLWRPFRGLRIFVEYEYFEARVNTQDMGPTQLTVDGVVRFDYDKRGLGRSFTTQGPLTRSINTQHAGSAEVILDVADGVTFRAMGARNRRDTDLLLRFAGNPFTNTAYRARRSFPEIEVDGVKLDLLVERDIGSVRSRTLFGYEWNENTFSVDRYETTAAVIGRLFQPDGSLNYSVGTWPNNFTLAGSTVTSAEWSNYRVTETISAMDNRLTALAGIAYGRSTRRNELTGATDQATKTTYQFGANYEVVSGVNLFANTSTSYLPQFGQDIAGNPVSPMTGIGYEVGAKASFLNDSLFATFTLFQLERSNIARRFQEPDTLLQYDVLSGKEQARGGELELHWRVTPSWELTAGAIAFDGEVVSDVERPQTVGMPLPRAPDRAFNLWTRYEFQDGPLHGFFFGGGLTYRTSTGTSANLSQPGLVSDSHTLLDLHAGYRFRVGGQRFTVVANGQNVTNEKYIRDGGNYGPLRMAQVALRWRY